MKRIPALCALIACMAVHKAAWADQPPPGDELGLEVGAASPICDIPCAPHLGPAAHLHVLFKLSRVFKLGPSYDNAHFSYVDTNTLERGQADSFVLGLLMRLYPVMGRRAGLYLDIWPGFYASDMDQMASFGLALGARTGVPIVISRRFRVGPYLSAAIHGHASEQPACFGQNNPVVVSHDPCPVAEPAHLGFWSFGLQTTFLFGPAE